MKLEIKGLTKRFGSFTANDHIDLTIEPGEIHCLLGENGAGKSTLMNMLYGLLDPTEGEILVDGKPVTFGSPSDAIAAGIGMVHQHFMLVPVFTVAENVMLGREQTSAPRHPRRAARPRRWSASCPSATASQVDPDALVEELPVGVQQRVEIIKALSNEAKVLILDEPTAVLTPQEIDELMDIMRSLKEQGTSIIFITHKLREVKAVGDRIIGDPARQGGRHRAAHGVRGRAGRDDGRPRGEAQGRQGAAEDRRRRHVGRGLHRGRPARPPGRQGRLVRGPGRRGARHRRRAGQRPDRADQGAARAGASPMPA